MWNSTSVQDCVFLNLARFNFSYAGFHEQTGPAQDNPNSKLCSQNQTSKQQQQATTTTKQHLQTAAMIIAPSINSLKFFSANKVDIVPVLKEETATPALGQVEQSRVRLGMDQNILSRAGDSFQIISAITGAPYLQAKSNGDDIAVLGNAAGDPVTAIERICSIAFKISSKDQTPLATVTKQGKVLHVIVEGDSTPTYTIHKVVSHPSRSFPTKHIIKHQGKPVASTRYGRGNSYVLTIDAGVDTCLVTCFAAIADEILA